MMSELESINDGMPSEIASLASAMEIGVLAKCEACGDELDIVDLHDGPLDSVSQMLASVSAIARVTTALQEVQARLDVDDEVTEEGESDPLVDFVFAVEDALTNR